MSQHYVYLLVNPTTKKPFYVGEGKDNRYNYHFLESQNLFGRPKQKYDHIQHLLKSGFSKDDICIIDKYFPNKKSARRYEYKLIKKYGRKGIDKNGILYNTECQFNPNKSYERSGITIKQKNKLKSLSKKLDKLVPSTTNDKLKSLSKKLDKLVPNLTPHKDKLQELSHKLEYFSPENNWKRYKEQVKKNPNDFILGPQPASICVVDGKITFEY